MMTRLIKAILVLMWATSLHAFNVTSVVTTPDISGNLVTMTIDFQMEETVDNWLFGFYMPRTFITSAGNNPSLVITIIDQSAPLSPVVMNYVTKSANPTVYGDGSVNVFAPVSSFTLTAGHSYTVTFQDSNQPAPNNLSSDAQNFFLYNTTQQTFLTAVAPVEAYGSDINLLQNLGGYDYAAVQTEILAHNFINWADSAPLVPGQLSDIYHLVPAPQSMSLLGSGATTLLRERALSLYNDFSGDQTLQSYLNSDLNIRVIPVTNPTKADIIIQQNSAVTNPEGYLLRIENNKILIQASNDAGAFYGIQTLRQLWHQTLLLPAMLINDAPRFQYRGILLDVARHFFTVSQIQTLIDAMAAQKLNTLHIHFSDDEGWRLTIASLLETVLNQAQLRGFVPGSTNVPGVFSQANLNKPNYINDQQSFDTADLIVSTYPAANTAYEGIFSMQDIQSIIAYANQNKITVIPELDFPGHAYAIVEADPIVFVDPNDTSVYVSVQGYYNDVVPVCLYNNVIPLNAFTNTMNNIIAAVSDLFMNQTTLYYQNEVSLGADEVSADAWTSDTTCSSNPNWASLTALSKSHYFFSLIAAANSGVKISGYQQLVQNNDTTIDPLSMPPANVGRIWVWEPAPGGLAQAEALVEADYPIVFSVASDLYFDLTYSPDAWEPGFYWAGSFLDTHAALNAAADVDTVLAGVPGKQQLVLGLEGSLWGENMMDFKHLAYMALPKMTGLAEAAWARNTVVGGNLVWQSLATRLGIGVDGFLNYLYSITGLQYRGFPDGISLEVPPTMSVRYSFKARH